MSPRQPRCLHVVSLQHVIPSPSTSLATRHWLSRSSQPLIRHTHSSRVRSCPSYHRHFSNANVYRAEGPYRETKEKRRAWAPVGDDFISEESTSTPNAFRKVDPGKGREDWQIQKSSLKEKFKEGWNPRKKLSPDAQDGIRALNAQQPEIYTTEVLAQEFQVSPEAIRRILKSKWRPTEAQAVDRHRRWENRGLGIWAAKTAMGFNPPRRWRDVMNEKIEHSGRDGAAELIRGPVAQAMLSYDMAMKNKASQEKLKRLQQEEKEAAMAARAHARSRSVLDKFKTASRSRSANTAATVETVAAGRPPPSESVNHPPEVTQIESLLS